MRWSKLKSEIERLFDPSLNLKIYCTVQRGERDSIGRIWFTFNGLSVWDEPKRVSRMLEASESNREVSTMTELLKSYLNAPPEQLIELNVEGDRWGLFQILKAADRRVGKGA